MRMLKFNDEWIEARQGETLLDAARRQGSTVWFVCDGRGICQTCECHVPSGGENLSEPSAVERTGLGKDRRANGYRLGCQARLIGGGSVSVVSRAEQLRRRAQDVLADSEGQNLWERLGTLATESIEATAGMIAGMMSASPYAFGQIMRHPPTPARLASYARDAVRVARNYWKSGRPPHQSRAGKRTDIPT